MSVAAENASGPPEPGRTTSWSSLQLPHAALTELYGVTRPTVTRAIHEIGRYWPPAASLPPVGPTSGCTRRPTTSSPPPGPKASSFDGTQTQVRRPKADRPGRKASVSGKKKQHTAKTTTVTDSSGRLLWPGADRPGRMHDQAALRTEGIAEQLRTPPQVTAMVDEGHRGPANDFPDQVQAPPRKPKDEAPLGEKHAWRKARRRQSSRICGEHTTGEEHKQRRTPPSPAGSPPAPDEHRTGPRPASRLLITHQPAATQAHRSWAVSRSESRLAGTPRTVLGRIGPPLSRPGRQRMFRMPEKRGKASKPNAAASPHEERKPHSCSAHALPSGSVNSAKLA
ncbi:transposase family protein [Streptomyces mirabilis]|uniref:transposase family protein n=1 Tax=Streptomyces mirabilis TaxID=68239 RepID=UPI00332B6189